MRNTVGHPQQTAGPLVNSFIRYTSVWCCEREVDSKLNIPSYLVVMRVLKFLNPALTFVEKVERFKSYGNRSFYRATQSARYLL